MKSAGRGLPVRIVVFTLFILGMVFRTDAQTQVPTATASLEAVDATNRVIAPVCTIESGPAAVLCFKANGLFFRLAATGSGFVAQEETFFTSTNCTAPAVVAARGQIYPTANIAGSSLFLEDTAAPLQSVTVNSKRDLSGNCVLLPVPTALSNVHAATELAGFDTFFRPFSIREKASDGTTGATGSTGSTGGTGVIPGNSAPTVPANLAASAAGPAQINLTWLPSQDDVAVTGYRIERCEGGSCTNFTQIAAPAATAYSDLGLSVGTSYRYRVRAADAAGNVSSYSNSADATTPAVTANLGLVAAYSFDEGSGTNVADLSGHNNKGNLTNSPAWTQGKTGTGLSFNGNRQAVEVPDAPSLQFGSAAFTVSAWVYTRSFDNAIFFGKYGTSGNGWRLQSSASGRLTLYVNDAQNYSAGDQVVLNQWQHLTAVQSDKGVKLYVNGVNVTQYGPTSESVDNTAPLTIGTTMKPPAASCCQAYFDGIVDDLRIYNRALTAEEIQADMSTALGASATTTDTIPPTAPLSLIATSASSTQINLIWTASTDNAGVTAYSIERCQGTGCADYVPVRGTDPNTTSFSDSDLIPNTTYSYRVRASDGTNFGGYSGIATAVTPVAEDIAAPTAPANLTSTARSSSEVELSWTASTDNIGIAGYQLERCAQAGCTTFSGIGTAIVTSFSDAFLTSNTSYSYRVRAVDAAGNASGYSNTAVAATPVNSDTTAPTSPSNLTVTPINPTQMDLVWTPSTDEVGVTSYRIERCQGAGCSNFAQAGTATGASYTDAGLSGNLTYTYRVRALDAAANSSGYSNTASGTTPLATDTTAPGSPANLTAAADGAQINLAWEAATDNIAVTGYRLERCQGINCVDFAEIATLSGRSYSDTGLAGSTSYRYRVRAADASGNMGAYSPIASATTPDTSAPTTPLNLIGTASSATQINLNWTASSDNLGVTAYRIERCESDGCSNFVQIATTFGPAYSDTGLADHTSHSYRVRAVDAALNTSGYSEPATVVTPSLPDTTAPTVPQGLTAAGTGATQIELNWIASTDKVGVKEYRIERCQGAGCVVFTEVGSAAGTSYINTGIAATTTYSYRVVARDAAGNASGFSNIATATTPDMQAPTAPAGLTATPIGGNQINLSWTASTDNIGVSGYVVLGCQGDTCSTFVQVAATSGTTFNHVGLAEGFTYKYRVRATDAVGMLSGDSNTATAVLDVSKPTAPAGLTGSLSGPTKVSVQWTASTDNRAVTGYQVERCEGQGCSAFTQIGSPATTTFSDTVASKTKDSIYYYRVRATDAKGNLSDYSASASIATVGDLTPPTAPGNLHQQDADQPALFLVGGDTYILSTPFFFWNSSTDNIGVTKYQLERCLGLGCSEFTVLGDTAGTTLSDPNWVHNTSHTYRVRARDEAGNLSNPSNSLTWTNGATSPTFPSLGYTVMGADRIDLSWTEQSTNVTMYFLERCVPSVSGCAYTLIASVPQKTYSDTGLIQGTTYQYRVRARADLNFSGYSNNVSAMTTDTQAPTASSLTATPLSGTQVKLTWTSSDNVAVARHLIERCTGIACSNFAQIAVQIGFGANYTDTGLSEAVSYSYRVRAVDAASNQSAYSNTGTATTPDTIAPTAPTGVTATPGTAGKIVLSWTASTDAGGLVDYLIERCEGTGCRNFTEVATLPAPGTQYTQTGLTNETRYSYRVRARDSGPNLSAYSNTSTGRADSEAPTKPTGLTLSGSKLSWTASTDNIGVTSYTIERCQELMGATCNDFSSWKTVDGTTLSKSGLESAPFSIYAPYEYLYRVKAKDAAGNSAASSGIRY